MDSGRMSAPEVARELGVSLPAAHHALDLAGIPRPGRGHVRVASRKLVEEIVARRGSAPPSDRSASELRVLAALSRSPLGLKSVRAVAWKAGVSPTTASRVLRTLEDQKYVEQRDTVVASGRARREERWFAGPRRLRGPLAESVRSTRLPERREARKPMPAELTHLFWNADVSKLDPKTDGSYMAERLLRAPDVRAWQWALTNLAHSDVETALSRRGIDDRTRALVRNWWAEQT